MSESSPCQHCGACCAHFRVTFYWAEADDAPGGTVPVALTHQQSPTTRCMQGTDTYQPHCIALEGEVGCAVSCRIYAARPSPCREVMPGDAHCTRARAAWGLSPLDPPAPGRVA